MGENRMVWEYGGGGIWEIDTCGEGAGLVEGKCLHDALI